jgi:hypothetical protein
VGIRRTARPLNGPKEKNESRDDPDFSIFDPTNRNGLPGRAGEENEMCEHKFRYLFL